MSIQQALDRGDFFLKKRTEEVRKYEKARGIPSPVRNYSMMCYYWLISRQEQLRSELAERMEGKEAVKELDVFEQRLLKIQQERQQLQSPFKDQ